MRKKRSTCIYRGDRINYRSIVPLLLVLTLVAASAGAAMAHNKNFSNEDLAASSENKDERWQGASAQTQQEESKIRNITGKIVDENGEPLPGAYVMFTETGTDNPEIMIISSIDGKYSIAIPDGVSGTLTFSFIGTKKYTERVSDKSIIDVVLISDISQVGEVVVTGIFSRKTDSYTGAVNTVKAEEIQRFGNRDILTTIRNVEPAFNIIESNTYGSNPNIMPTVQIRGNTSIPNVGDLQDEAAASLNTPLVILDGFESTMSVLQDMNENDLESITILKDASATAIYGSRGANGVVVITTKQPEAGDMRVTWRSDLTIEAPDLTSYDMLNAREKLALEETVGFYESSSPRVELALKQYYNSVLGQINKGVDTYWLSKPLRTGIGQKHSIRLEGGDRGFRYSGTVRYNDIKGAMIGSDREVFNGALKLVLRHKKILFQNNLMIGITNQENSPYGNFSQYVRMNPYWSGYDEDGNLLRRLGDYGDDSYQQRWPQLPNNPLYNATLNTFDKSENTTITNNLSLEWNILKELKFRAQLGIMKTDKSSDNFVPPTHSMFDNYDGDDIFRKGSYTYGSGDAFSYDASLNLGYNKVFNEKHFLFAGANYNIRENNSENYYFSAFGFTSANVDYLAAARYADTPPSGSEGLTRSMGVTFNSNYMYDNRYFADFSYRTDGSSQFGADKRFAPFWAFGLGWNVHEENFFKNNVVNRLKLRASTGTSGSQNFNPYQAMSTYKYEISDRYFGWTGAHLMALGNEDLKWQQTFSYNIGAEAQFIDGRISAVFDYYNKITDGMISSVNIPSSTGYDSYIANIGEVENRGFEFKLSGYILRNYKKGLSWNLGISGIHNVNEITELSAALKEAQRAMEGQATTSPKNLYREGYSMNTIWVVRSMGIAPSNGKEIFLDKNGEMTSVWSSADLIDGGNTTPKLQGNINSSFRRKNLTVTLSFGYRLGGQIYNSTLISRVENADYRYNVDSRVYDDRWQQPGDEASFKSLYDTNTTYKSTRFVEDENTLTLQNINVRYDLKAFRFVKNLGIESFVLNANAGNLFYVSTVKQERGTSYPFARNFALGLNVIF
ncbi:MAG: SusC/RagA family TonB-linked outer membrane protein [Bacteroidales bacterium]